MATRGRPRKDGLQPVWMLGRRITALHAFNKARKNGEKYEAAIMEAIESVKTQNPKMRIGPRMIKGILSGWQPKLATRAVTVFKVSDGELQSPEMQQNLARLYELDFPKGKRVTVFTVGVGSRPEYPRVNAKQRTVDSGSN